LGDSNQGLGDTCTCFKPALAVCRSEMEYLGVRIYIYMNISIIITMTITKKKQKKKKKIDTDG
jgi:hypothetical protein